VGRRRQGRDVRQCEVGRRGVGSRGVSRAARGQTGGAESDRWRGRGGCARGVGRLGARGSVGQLDRWVQVMDVCSIILWRRYSSPRVMDPWVHHPDQPTGHRPSQGV
jgi:hypothetical protein